MRYRDYKEFLQGGYYHIYNRGNNKQPIFLDRQDYLNFFKRIKLILGLPVPEFSRSPLVTQGDSFDISRQSKSLHIKPFIPNSFSILSNCLMPNHFHFLIGQNTAIGIDRFISKLCTSYSAYFNRKYNRVGHVFQDAFKAKPIESDEYLIYLSAYIHNNPDKPAQYQYSSFPDYIGERTNELYDTGFLLGMFNNDREAYKRFVLGFSQEQQDQIKDFLFDED